MKDTADKFKKLLTANGAELVNEENWGLRKLAYPVQHKSTGFYNLYEFKAKPEIVAILETEYRRDEAVLRFLTVSLDKHAIAYNEKRKRGDFRKDKKEKKEKEAAA